MSCSKTQPCARSYNPFISSQALNDYSGYIQASMSNIQGLLKASPTIFKDLKLMKNTDLRVKILLQKY